MNSSNNSFEEQFDCISEIPHNNLMDLQDIEELQQISETLQTSLEEEVSRDVLKQINTTFTSKLEQFTTQLYNKLNVKNKEFLKLKEYLATFRVYYELIDKEILEKKKQQKETRSQVTQNRKKVSMIEDHLRSGVQVRQIIYDANINPFYLSFNPIKIYFEIPQNIYMTRVLDLFDEHLRNQKNSQYYIKYVTLRATNTFVQKFIEVQLQGGKIQFDIKAGDRKSDMDMFHYQILKVYASLSDQFRRVCAFLAFWANQRGILSNQCLNEKGLYFMVIELFQMMGLLPNIFSEEYCFWEKEKLQMINQVQKKIPGQISSKIDFKLLNKYFTENDYYIMRIKAMSTTKEQFNRKYFYEVIFLKYPKPEEIEQVKQKWSEEQIRMNQKTKIPTLGSLISSFFHSFANPNSLKAKRMMAINNQQSYPYSNEIGYYMIDPVFKDQNILPFLKKKPSRDFEKNEFERVQEEFQRSYRLIKNGKFDQICDEYKGIMD